jgi:hypothetical protein
MADNPHDPGYIPVILTISDLYQVSLRFNADVNHVAASGAAVTLASTYKFHDVILSENCTFTFSAPDLDGHCFALQLSGAYTVTWPASVDWSDGSLPAYTTPAVYTFATFDKGVTWRGNRIGKAFA